MSNETGQINVSVANMYREASYKSEIVNQGLLGESIIIEKNEKDFSLIRLTDGYRGWISNLQWVSESKKTYKSMKIRSHFVRIYNLPDPGGDTIRDATIGTDLQVVQKLND